MMMVETPQKKRGNWKSHFAASGISRMGLLADHESCVVLEGNCLFSNMPPCQIGGFGKPWQVYYERRRVCWPSFLET